MEKINIPGYGVISLPDNIDPVERAQIAADIKKDFGIDINQTTILGRAAELPKGIARGAIGLATDVPLGIASLLDVGDDGKVVKGLQGFKKKVREDSPLAAEPGYEDLWTTKLSEGLGSFVPFLGAGLVGRALTKTPKPFFSKGYFKTPEFTLPAALAVPTGVAQQADRVQMAREMGEDVGGISETVAELAGGVIGISEVLPIGALLARTSKTALKDYALRDKIRSALIQGTQEGAQEVFASLSQDLIARGLYSDELPIGESLADEFTIGGVIGAGADLVVNSFAGRRGIGNENLKQREAQLRQNRIQLQDEKRFDKAVEQGLVEEIQPVEVKDKPDIPIPVGEIQPLPNFEIIQDTQGNFNLLDTSKEGSPVLKTFEAEAEAIVAKEKELNKLRVKNLKIDIENALYNQGLINSASGFDLGVTLLDPNSIQLNPQSILNFDSKVKKVDRKDIESYFTKKKVDLKPTYTMQEVRKILAPKDLNRLQSDMAQQIFRQSEKRGEPSIRDDKSQVNVNNKYIKEIAASKNIELDFKDPAVQHFTREVTGYDDISKVKNRGAKELFLARLHSLPKFNFKTKLPDFRPRQYSAEDMANFVANMGINNTEFSVADLLKAGPTAGNKPATEQFVRDLTTSGRANKVEGTNKYKINKNYEFEVARKAEGFNETPEEFGERLVREGVLPQETIDQLIEAEKVRQEKYLPPKEVAPKMINFAQSVEEGRVNKFAQEAKKILDKAGLKDTGVIISDEILSTEGLIETPDGVIKRDPKVYRDETSFAEGEYDRNTDIVFVSLNAVNPDGLATDAEIQQRINRIIDHEMIHALRAKDLINEQEYQYLRQEVKRRKVPESVDEEAFAKNKTYYQRSIDINEKTLQGRNVGKDRAEEFYVEEAIAELYRNRFSQPAIPKKAETIFEKITQFFKSLGQAFRRSGFDKSSDIFRAIEEGEVGKRERGEIRTLREIDRVPLADELQPIVEIDETRETGIDDIQEDASDGTIATTVKTSTNSFYRDLKPGAVKGVLVKGKVGSSIEDTGVLYDIRKLSREEIAADRELILKEFAGKDSIEIAEWLSKNGPSKDYQLIAERIHKQLKKFKDKTGFNFTFNFYTGAGDARPGYDRRYLGRKRRRILGVSMYPQPEYDNGKTFRIYINNTETNGVDFNTILHELVHAATQAGTTFAKYKSRTSFDKTNLIKGTEKLERIRSRLKKEIRKRKKDGENVDFYTEYGTLNIDELLAVGFTDREFQQFMESVEFAPKSKTLWESFVDAIRQILGLPAKAGTVFSEFLKEGSRYLQFTTQEVNQIAEYFTRYQTALEPLSTPVAAVSRPQDLPSFSRKSLDDEINKLGTQIYNLERRAEADRQYISNDTYNQDMRRIDGLKARQENLIRQRAELPPEQPPLFSRAQDIGSPLDEPLSYRLNDKILERWLKYHNYENLNERPGAPRTEGEIDAAYRKNDPTLNESYVLYPDRVETFFAPTGDKLSKKTYKNPTHRQLLVDFDYIPRTQENVPLFSRSIRYATDDRTSENKKLIEATERVEEIVKSTPNGEIPPVNPNASDVAFKAFLDFNDTSNTSTPPDDIPTFSVGAIPEEYQDQVDVVGYTEPRKSFGARMIDFTSDPISNIKNTFKFVRTQLIDKYDLIDKKITQAIEDNDEVRANNNTADTSTMASLRMTDRARGLFQGMLTRGFVSDSIKGEDALANVIKLKISTIFNPYIEGDFGFGGLMQIISPLYADPTVNREFLFKLYATSKRTENFDKNGQLVESPLTKEKAQENIRNIEQNYPSVVEVYNNYQNWNNQLITFAENKGLLDPQQARLWREHSAYYPFYRKMVDEENILGPRIAAGSLPNNPLSIQITGSENPLDVDPIEAIARNSLSILTAALKNDGTSKLLRDLQAIGSAKKLESPDEIKRASQNRIFVFENGQKTFYSLDDPELFYGLQAVGGMNTDFITKILAMPASILRDTVTRDPGFVVVNILRDTLSSAVTSGAPIGADGFRPVIDSFKNMFEDMENLEKFGVLGGYDFQNDEGTVKQFIDRSMRQEGLMPDNSASAQDMFFKLWDGLGALTTKSDGATRKAVYDAVYKDLIKRNYTEAQAQSEAAYQALEIINFGRRGLSPMFRTITAAIPFLNARIQGLDVLFRSFTGKYSAVEKLQEGETREDVRKRILKTAITRGGFLMALTAMYYMMVSDDEEYRGLRREVRDDNWIIPLVDGIPALKIPIPFEVGMIFKTFPERFIDEFMGREIEPEPLTSVKRQLGTSAKVPFFDGGLGFQLLKPIAEVYQNRNTFTNTEIIPYYQQKLESGLQSRRSTNELLRVIGETLNVSPAKLEHLFRGYTGTLGGYVLDVADVTARGVTGTPLIPPNLNSIPVLRRLLQDIDRSGGGLQQQFYELRSEVDTAVQTMNKLRKDERFDEYSAYRSNMQGILNVKGQVRSIERYMDNYRKRRDRLLRRTDISPTARGELLKQMELERDRRLAIVPELRDRANIPVIRGI